MTVRRLVALVVTAVVTAAVLTGCSGGGEKNWATKCTTTNGVVECTPEQRTPVKPVSGELLDGGTYDVSQDRGKVVVVNFWGSWCGPCRSEADDLEKTFQATKDKGVAFLGINSRDGRDAAKAFERRFGVTYPSLFDFDAKLALQFDVTQVATPATLILDRQGRIAVALRQPTTVTQLQPLVERIAAEEAS